MSFGGGGSFRLAPALCVTHIKTASRVKRSTEINVGSREATYLCCTAIFQSVIAPSRDFCICE